MGVAPSDSDFQKVTLAALGRLDCAAMSRFGVNKGGCGRRRVNADGDLT